MKGEKIHRDQNHFDANMLFDPVRLDMLTWGSMRIDLLVEPASSELLQFFAHLLVKFIFQQLPLGINQ